MRKILVLCLLLGLVMVPAAVTAAGAQGQGMRGAQGNAALLQEQTDESGTAAGHYQFCAQHGSTDVSKAGNGKMLRIRDCTAGGSQAAGMARNQSRLRDGTCGNCPAL